MPNQTEIALSSTVDEIASIDIVAGTGVFENGLFKFYTGDATAGQPTSPVVRMVRVRLDKTTQADTWAIGEAVNYDEATQKVVKAGGVKCGIAGAASTASHTFVSVRINE